MKFSAKIFSSISFVQTCLFAVIFFNMGQGWPFLFSMGFLSLNVLFWAIFVHIFVRGTVKENLSPILVLLCMGKVVISFCVLWLLLEEASAIVVVSSNALVALSLILSCVLHRPNLEFSHVK